MWSAGVIFFQMLYGRRPFGHDMTQVWQLCVQVREAALGMTRTPVCRRPFCAMKPFSAAREMWTFLPNQLFRTRRVLLVYLSLCVPHNCCSGQGLHPPVPHLQSSRAARRAPGCWRCVPELPEGSGESDLAHSAWPVASVRSGTVRVYSSDRVTYSSHRAFQLPSACPSDAALHSIALT